MHMYPCMYVYVYKYTYPLTYTTRTTCQAVNETFCILQAYFVNIDECSSWLKNVWTLIHKHEVKIRFPVKTLVTPGEFTWTLGSWINARLYSHWNCTCENFNEVTFTYVDCAFSRTYISIKHVTIRKKLISAPLLSRIYCNLTFDGKKGEAENKR